MNPGGQGPAPGPDPGPNPADDLASARDLLPAPAAGRRRLAGAALRRALVELHDFWLGGHAGRVGLGERRAALLAVGALGRRELMPHSDLDLLLVFADGTDPSVVDSTAEQVWYPLWDAGIEIDHSVRTVDEAIDASDEDIRTALGLLDARHLAGDEGVSARLLRDARHAWRTGIRRRYDELLEISALRWRRSGEIARRAEPDLKNGRGGSRDVALLHALAAAQLLDRPSEEVHAAAELLLDVRTELRRVDGRAQDVLRAQHGDEVAAALGMGERFALARALSGAARTIDYATTVALRAGRASLPTGGRRRPPRRTPLDEGVVLHGSPPTAEVALARDAQPTADPALLLRVAAAAARTNTPVSSAALAALADSAPELRAPWPRAARVTLIELLGAGPGLLDVVEALEATGLWGRLFGEWSAIRDLPPRDAAHVWTVDRHLVQTCVHAAELTTSVSRPDLLLLGALLHDIGKGRDADHSEIGAALAEQVAERLGLPGADAALLRRMVRHHLLLPAVATRRDITDPRTVQRVTDTLDGDPLLLELLVALTEADSKATGPGLWTPWRAGLVGELAANCRARMTGGPLPVAGPPTPEQVELADRVSGTHRAELTLTAPEYGAAQDWARLTVAAPDRPGLLSTVAGALALHTLRVHSATLGSAGTIALDEFAVSPRFGSLPPQPLLAEQLARALAGTLPLAERVAAKERDYRDTAAASLPPKVRWFGTEDGGGPVFELRAADRIGLLYSVATAVERCGLDLRWAKGSSFGAAAVYACGIDGSGGLRPTPGVLRELERRLLAAGADEAALE